MVLAYMRALDMLNGRLRRQEGQALVEYALIISLVAVALIGALTFKSGKIDGIFSTIGNALPGSWASGDNPAARLGDSPPLGGESPPASPPHVPPTADVARKPALVGPKGWSTQ